jgi:hypothetical protein
MQQATCRNRLGLERLQVPGTNSNTYLQNTAVFARNWLGSKKKVPWPWYLSRLSQNGIDHWI